MQEKILNIEMMGGFQAHYGDQVVVALDARNSKVLHLWQYLLCRRGSMVSQGELIQQLLDEDQASNPVATLKNLVYRLRKLLKAAGLPQECIQYRKGAYAFAEAVPCRVDKDEFLRLAQAAQDRPGTAERLTACLDAVALYKGGFLPKQMGEPWAIGIALRLQERYFDCLRCAFAAAQQLDQYQLLAEPLGHAATLYPYEESVNIMHILCLHQMQRTREALDAYEAVATLLMDDLGIGPTEAMSQLYQTISDGLQEVVTTPEDARSKLREEYVKGSFYCNLEVFRSLYHFVVRHMERSGQSVFLMLCTVSEADGMPPSDPERRKLFMQGAQGAIKAALRRGDAYTRYSPTQFLLLLMQIKQENCTVVADRLRQRFYSAAKLHNAARLSCKSLSAAAVDFLAPQTGEAKRAW